MPSICAYPARPWACDSSVSMATPHQAFLGSLLILPWTPEVGPLDAELGVSLLKHPQRRPRASVFHKAPLFLLLTLIPSILGVWN